MVTVMVKWYMVFGSKVSFFCAIPASASASPAPVPANGYATTTSAPGPSTPPARSSFGSAPYSPDHDTTEGAPGPDGRVSIAVTVSGAGAPPSGTVSVVELRCCDGEAAQAVTIGSAALDAAGRTAVLKWCRWMTGRLAHVLVVTHNPDLVALAQSEAEGDAGDGAAAANVVTVKAGHRGTEIHPGEDE